MSATEGASWTKISGSLPALFLAAVSVDPSNENDILVAGYSRNSTNGVVFRCTAPTANPPVWTQVAHLDSTVYALARDPADTAHQWYAGNNTGVWFTPDGGNSWQDVGLSNGLPRVSVRDLGSLYAATYGRGIWQVQVGCQTCATLGDNCGTVSDGCGHTLDCGTCTSPQWCGGGGSPNVCGVCKPRKCFTGACGTLSDGCGNEICCGGFRCCT
jgi:hypothetical protein